MKLAAFGEDAFLRELQNRVPPSEHVSIGIGDDAAAVSVPDGELVLLTVDTLVEGTHFLWETTPPLFLGRKAVAVSASDIAAMGGLALGVLLSLCVSGDIEVETLWQIVDGAAERCGELGMGLVGGNLARSDGPAVVDVTVFGHTEAGKTLRRGGARAGDAIYVSGKIGASAVGLWLLQQGVALSPSGGLVFPAWPAWPAAGPYALREGPLPLAEPCIRAHLDPEPRLPLGRELRARDLATACIDVSDGLSIDLHRLCRASGTGARIEEQALPLAPGALAWERQLGRDPVYAALSGGEDYELLFTARDASAIEAFRDTSDIAITRIGEMTSDGDAVELVRRDGSVEPLRTSGWDHFQERRS